MTCFCNALDLQPPSSDTNLIKRWAACQGPSLSFRVQGEGRLEGTALGSRWRAAPPTEGRGIAAWQPAALPAPGRLVCSAIERISVADEEEEEEI